MSKATATWSDLISNPADDYSAEANEILNSLTGILKGRPAPDDPSKRVDANFWWMKLIYLRVTFNWVMDRFQHDPTIDPTLRAMLRSFLKLDPLEGLLPDKEMSNKTFPAGEELRNRVKTLAHAIPENDEEAEEERGQTAAYASIYLWYLSQTKEEIRMKKSEKGVGAPSTDRVLRSRPRNEIDG
ncbi:hypothetical protein FANTH_13674 [Fusarium anthophilum]|uniref:Uncharacterized protein n=1 Tax=Fusarium anthophilum TaxID=48485 RepID=A0A8H5DPB1_9HYPO|nr:hypothetical protein FANTH_13674 [Fusarium anthophilum]